MNINEKINHNYKHSRFIVFVNILRIDNLGRKVYDSVQYHRIRKEHVDVVLCNMKAYAKTSEH